MHMTRHIKHSISCQRTSIASLCMLFAFLFASCADFGSEPDGGSSSDARCSVTVYTALAARSAFPSSAGSLHYYATIYDTTDSTYLSATGTSGTPAYLPNSTGDNATDAPTFLFPRQSSGISCTITLYGFAAAYSGTSYASDCLVSGAGQFAVAADQKTASVSALGLTLNASYSTAANTGNGSVSLGLTMSATLAAKVTAASQITATLDSTTLGSKPLTPAVSDTTTVTLSATGITAGVYVLSLLFKDSYGNVLPTDFAGQAVSVFPGMTTDVWYSNSTKSDSLSVALTSGTMYYVGGTGGVSAAAGYSASDTNSGISLASPFASVQKAVDRIVAANDGSSTYYLYIDGQVTGSNGVTTVSTESSTKPLTLIIAGLNSDNTKDVVSASGVIDKNVFYLAGATGAALTVTIRNLGITGASNTSGGFGGGINCNQYAALVLDGAHVYGNTALYGGGIYSDGSLTLQNGTVIGDSTQTTAAMASSYSNLAKCNSAGIRSNGTLVIKNGCYVAYNFNDCTRATQDAGGVWANGSSFTLESGAFIQYNGTASNGGGLAVENASASATVQGTIRGNTATGNGNGVYVSAGTFAMQGSAVVTPTGTGANDVYLAAGKTVKIAGSLSASTAAAITPATYASGTTVLTQSSDNLVAGNYSRFTLSNTTPKDTASTPPFYHFICIDSSGSIADEDMTASIIAGRLSDACNKSSADSNTLFKLYIPDEAVQLADTLSVTAGNIQITGRGTTSELKACVVDAASAKRIITISGGSLALQSIILSGGGKKSDSNTDNGGGIFIAAGASAAIKSGTIIKNCKGHSGGGIKSQGSLTVESGAQIINNSCYSDGGGISISDGSLSITGGTISNNSSGISGGGISCSECSSISIQNATIENNSATGGSTYGGGGIYIYNLKANATIASSTIRKNKITTTNNDDGSAGGYGGGIYLKQFDNNNVYNLQLGDETGSVSICNNFAKDGGGVCLDGGILKVVKCSIIDNAALNLGGGVYIGNYYGHDSSSNGYASFDGSSCTSGNVLVNSGNYHGTTLDANYSPATASPAARNDIYTQTGATYTAGNATVEVVAP